MTHSNTKPVEDVAEFITRLKDLKLYAGQRRFFRGHSKHSYNLKPAVYRDATLKDNESALYHDCLRLVPEAFTEDSTTIERLVRMQHEELPTRLLDVTASPLAALFFCVRYANDEGKATEEDGEVIIFDWPENALYHSATLPEVSLVGVERKITKEDWEKLIRDLFFLDSEIKIKELKILRSKDWVIQDEDLLNIIEKHINYNEENTIIDPMIRVAQGISDSISKVYEHYYIKKDKIIYLKNNDSIIDSIIDDYNNFKKIDNKTKKQILIKLKKDRLKFKINKRSLESKKLNSCNHVNFRKEEKIGLNTLKKTWDIERKLKKIERISRDDIVHNFNYNLTGQLKYQTLESDIFSEFIKNIINNILYLPPLNNPRIKAQQGAFILCSPVANKLGDLNEQIHDFSLPRMNPDGIKIHRIRISHAHKATILEELDNLGVSEATMFPDLRTQIKSLEHRYKAKQ